MVSTGIWGGERKISYSLPLQVLRYRMRWFKVSEGGRLLKAPRVMSSMRSAVRDLQVLDMVIVFVGISRGEWVGRVVYYYATTTKLISGLHDLWEMLM